MSKTSNYVGWRLSNVDKEITNQNGSYIIQEQGDLGLGTTPIDPKYVGEDGKISIPKDDKERERG